MSWHSFEEGRTMGKTGAEGGVITLDEEHTDGARITVERGCLRAPFAITCGVYGWMVHTRFIADDETAQHAADEMKTALSQIVALISKDGETEMMDTVTDAIAEFTERFA